MSQSSGSQSVVPEPEARILPGNLLEMQTFQVLPQTYEFRNPGVGPSDLSFNQPPPGHPDACLSLRALI